MSKNKFDDFEMGEAAEVDDLYFDANPEELALDDDINLVQRQHESINMRRRRLEYKLEVQRLSKQLYDEQDLEAHSHYDDDLFGEYGQNRMAR